MIGNASVPPPSQATVRFAGGIRCARWRAHSPSAPCSDGRCGIATLGTAQAWRVSGACTAQAWVGGPPPPTACAGGRSAAPAAPPNRRKHCHRCRLHPCKRRSPLPSQPQPAPTAAHNPTAAALLDPASPDLPIGLGQHLGRKVLLGPFAVPGWALPLISILGTAMFTGLVTGSVVGVVLAPSQPPPTPAASSSAPALPTTPTDVPIVELAAAGDPDAIAKLSAKPSGERTLDEVVALANGAAVKRKADLATLANDLHRNPSLGSDPDILKRLRKATENDELARDALRIMATLPGSKPADVIYDLWVGTPKRTPTTELAEQLVYTKEVRQKASPALAVALDLREADTCEQVKPVVARAVEEGDRRSLRLLGKLTLRYGCGKGKGQDCWACLREEDTLTDALKAVVKRPPPKL